MQLLPHHQTFIDRFIAACQTDKRVVAAFLVGSYAWGTADAYSDLDLYLITADDAYEDFFAGREAFMQRLGDLAFLEDFGLPDIVFYIFADGSEGELMFGRESQINHIFSGPYRVLLDKKGIMTEAVFLGHTPAQTEQIEKLRRQLYWFWHDLSHLITALGRGQLWWASGQLEVLRGYCVNLARLKHNFADADVGEEAYFKIEKAISIESLSALQATFCPMERGAMLQSVLVILRFYQELARDLARAHGIAYPADLERVMVDRLEKLRYVQL